VKFASKTQVKLFFLSGEIFGQHQIACKFAKTSFCKSRKGIFISAKKISFRKDSRKLKGQCIPPYKLSFFSKIKGECDQSVCVVCRQQEWFVWADMAVGEPVSQRRTTLWRGESEKEDSNDIFSDFQI
jgi:hypothetical protein